MSTRRAHWAAAFFGMVCCVSVQAQVAAPFAGTELGYLGLQSASGPTRIHCGTLAFTCDSGGLRVYAGAWRGRPLGVDLSTLQVARAGGQVQGLKVSLVGKPSRDSALNVFGRVGSGVVSGTSVMGAGPAGGGGVAYGVGVSWDFARSASAVLSWDAYDFRWGGGEREPVRAASLGLQWRY